MRNGFMKHAAEGALGGALGTLALSGVMSVSRRIPVKIAPTPVREDPGEVVVRRLERLRGRPLPPSWHQRLAHGLHWAYGIGWGSLFGLATAHKRLLKPRDALLFGAGLGTLVWAVGYAGWLPAAKLTPPLHRQGGRHILMSWLEHVGFGVLSTVPVLLIDRLRRPPWYRAALDKLVR